MTWNINVKATKSEVLKLVAETKPPADANSEEVAQFANAKQIIAAHVGSYADVDPTKGRQIEVIASGAVGQPAGSRHLSIKIEG